MKEIRYPNTVSVMDQEFFTTEKYIIEEMTKNGEMAPVKWFAVYKKDTKEKVAEIKESVCNVYF